LAGGDRPAFEERLRTLRERSARGHSAFQKATCEQWEATLALLDGRFAEVEALAGRQLETARHDMNFELSYAGQVVAVLMQTGRDHELLDAIDRAIDLHPNLPLLRATKAWVCSSAGREETAREAVDDLAPAQFAKLGGGLLWSAGAVQVAEAIAATSLVEHARTLYPLLEPWSGQCIVVGQGLDVPGAADRYLGMLALTAGNLDRAHIHFAAAVDLEERMQSPPLIARTRYWWGRALLTRREGDDVERATSLLTQCLATAAALGMTRLATQASAGIGTV
jgi:tetratricopeptide (TPR) repeat protein